jgi:hypothetical protein
MAVFNYEDSFVEIRFPIVQDSTGSRPADNFLKVKETLTRIGAPAYSKDPNVPGKTLWQSCHILYKRQKYYLVHFKEMFLLDGKASRTLLTDEDLARRNAIAMLLEQWGLIEIVNPTFITIPPPAPIDSLKIIPFKEKDQWNLRAKYEIGKTHL